MGNSNRNSYVLADGSRIGVIGGGPAGSFFAYFAFEQAQKKGISVEIDIFEAKNFETLGHAGCNHCGGIISESLVHQLNSDGIFLPPEVIRRSIESYTLHLENGSLIIDNLLSEKRIVSVYRGSGPLGASQTGQQSFDKFLLDLAVSKGAKVYPEKVIRLQQVDNQIVISTAIASREYDLVIGAAGLNPRSISLFQKVLPGYIPPKTAKTFISEYYLGSEKISKYLGNSMHVFLLNVPGIQFGALIPKGHYVTLVLLGTRINEEKVRHFVNSEAVKECFPEGTELKIRNPCQCFPSISITNAKNPFADRIVLIGDSASSKLYKNGIGAAYLTAKAAASAVVNFGFSSNDFRKHYKPECSKLDRDNLLGKAIFYSTTGIQKSSFLKKVLYRMMVSEQTKEKSERLASAFLWDIFTGSASYRNILFRILSPLNIFRVIRHIIAELKASRN